MYNRRAYPRLKNFDLESCSAGLFQTKIFDLGDTMKFTWVLVVSIIVSLFLSACGAQSATTNKPASTGDMAAEEVAYPGPQTTVAEPTAEVIASGAYPAPGSGEEISWENAKTMILNGEINQVMQAHTLVVTLFTKDGRVLVTIEPNSDDVLKIVEQCGDAFKDTTVVTE